MLVSISVHISCERDSLRVWKCEPMFLTRTYVSHNVHTNPFRSHSLCYKFDLHSCLACSCAANCLHCNVTQNKHRCAFLFSVPWHLHKWTVLHLRLAQLELSLLSMFQRTLSCMQCETNGQLLMLCKCIVKSHIRLISFWNFCELVMGISFWCSFIKAIIFGFYPS